MGGAGIIRCENCGFNRELVSFIHSFPMDRWKHLTSLKQKIKDRITKVWGK